MKIFAWPSSMAVLAALAAVGTLSGAAALAADPVQVGSATLTITMDTGDGYPFVIDVKQFEDGSVSGQDTMTQMGLVNFERTNCGGGHCGYLGWIGTGHIDFTCARGECGSELNSAQANLKVAADGTIDGSVNFDPVHAVNHQDYISVLVNGISPQDGAIELRQTRIGHYEGQGSIGVGMHSTFQATLDTEGSFLNMNQDPALFAAILIAPFARH